MALGPFSPFGKRTLLVDENGTPYKAAGTSGSTVALAAGSAAIGTLTGDSYAHITTATTTVVKASAGVVKAVVVNTKGTVASTVTVRDNATVIAIIDSLNLSGTWTLNVACATNITVITTGTVAPDVTVTYQ